MVDDKDRVIGKTGERPREPTEEETAFKEMLIPIVRNAFVFYEGKGWFDEAARFA